MVNTLFGTKVGMTSAYDSRGRRIGATVVELNPNFVTQVKTVEKDGYSAVVLGMGEKKTLRKAQLGHLKKAGLEKKLSFFREVTNNESDLQPGQDINMGQVFHIGDAVKVTGVSKGRGFQGGVRRHGFHGGPKTHGQSDRHRAPGSIGSGTTPGRVWKGKKMAGHMGMENVSHRGLEVVALDMDKRRLLIKGAVPGPIGGEVRIENIGKIKGYTPPPEEKPSEEEVVAEESSKADSTDKASEQPMINTQGKQNASQ